MLHPGIIFESIGKIIHTHQKIFLHLVPKSEEIEENGN